MSFARQFIIFGCFSSICRQISTEKTRDVYVKIAWMSTHIRVSLSAVESFTMANVKSSPPPPDDWADEAGLFALRCCCRCCIRQLLLLMRRRRRRHRRVWWRKMRRRVLRHRHSPSPCVRGQWKASTKLTAIDGDGAGREIDWRRSSELKTEQFGRQREENWMFWVGWNRASRIEYNDFALKVILWLHLVC